MYSGGLSYYHMKSALQDRVPLFVFPDNKPQEGKQAFCQWVKQHRPDAIVSFHALVPEWLREILELRVPEDIGLLVHDWNPRMSGFAGISHCRPAAAATTIDLIASQLMNYDRGIPSIPKQVLAPSKWVDGASVRSC